MCGVNKKSEMSETSGTSRISEIFASKSCIKVANSATLDWGTSNGVSTEEECPTDEMSDTSSSMNGMSISDEMDDDGVWDDNEVWVWSGWCAAIKAAL